MATVPRAWRLMLATAVAALAACDADTPEPSGALDPRAAASGGGDPAAWYVAPEQNLQESSTAFTALVTRVACNNGVTGEVLPPEVRLTPTEVIVTFQVAAAKDQEFAPCQGNDKVPYDVELGEPVNGRSLVDGLCLSADRAVARSIFCAPDATRSPR
ncbi:hypothetical protein [Actinoplanes sp. NPDC049316]|uniref:hypothetical protein n=1 Tax=Actinoplanes sp. NPDC049316 TaxID=3154727 RepID=UPI0034250ADD